MNVSPHWDTVRAAHRRPYPGRANTSRNPIGAAVSWLLRSHFSVAGSSGSGSGSGRIGSHYLWTNIDMPAPGPSEVITTIAITAAPATTVPTISRPASIGLANGRQR